MMAIHARFPGLERCHSDPVSDSRWRKKEEALPGRGGGEDDLFLQHLVLWHYRQHPLLAPPDKEHQKEEEKVEKRRPDSESDDTKANFTLEEEVEKLVEKVVHEADVQEMTLNTEKGKCIICLSCQTPLVYSCDDCQCSGAMCADCINAYLRIKIEDTKYTVSSIKCPGQCHKGIPISKWRGILQLSDEYDMESFLLSSYEHNASAILSIQCASCHENCDLTILPTYILRCVEERKCRLNDLLNYGESFPEKCQLQRAMMEEWVKFNSGEVSGEMLVKILFSYYAKSSKRTLVAHVGDDELSHDKDKFLRFFVLPLILDIEHRAHLQLLILKYCPRFVVPCCSMEHCFNCKVGGWHYGVECQEVQRKEIDIDAQFCPHCNIPTIRTEGCEDMLCLCGCVWSWEGDNEDY